MLRDAPGAMLEAGIDYLVLGCSHYPYLIPTLKKDFATHTLRLLIREWQ